MENQKTFRTPRKTLVRMQVVRFGQILFNLQFIALAVMLASVLSFIVYPLYFTLLVTIAILTLFTIFAWDIGFASWWKTDTLNKVTVFLSKTWTYTVPIVLVVSALSILCLCFDKNRRHTGRIGTCVAICVFAIIFLIFKAAAQ